MIATPALSTKQLAENLLGQICWISDTEGYCDCPGADYHTANNGARDCKVYLDYAPTLHCMHTSCRLAVEEKTRELRHSVASGSNQEVRIDSAQLKRREQEIERIESIRRRAARSRPTILRSFRWSAAQIQADSPMQIPREADGHWSILLDRFNDGDVVWIGDTFHSGPGFEKCFRSIEQWQQEVVAPAQFICPAVFKPGSNSRSNDNVLGRRFLVVESDELTHDEVGAIFKWLEQEVELPLRAVVDTAGKSLHGWFDFPPERFLKELKIILPELGCDPKLFTASQPVRLPGALRNGKHQRLLYLDKAVTK